MHTAKHTAGRRRKTMKKAKKGGYYSFNGALATGAADWSRHTEVPAGMANRGGNAQMGGKKRKGGKKTRKAKRGGGYFGQAVAGFTGTGNRGLANYPDVSAPTGKAAGGAFNDNGAKPGDFKSFITTSK